MLCNIKGNTVAANREHAVQQARGLPRRAGSRRVAVRAVGGRRSSSDGNTTSPRSFHPAKKAESCSLRFVVGIEVEERGSGVREALRCHSGDSLLRDVLQENLVAVDLYRHWGKVWQCGGSGRCGACMVNVTNGEELLSEHTQIEREVLQGKGCAGCRLACQAWVGNGRNSGHIHLSLDTPPS